METLCHQALGSFLLGMLKEDTANFNRSSLLRGIKAPDIKDLRRLKFGTLHTIDQSLAAVIKEFNAIFIKDNPRNGDISYRLGWVLHFVCDYFCLAHNLRYLAKNLALHAYYERKMSRLVKKKEILPTLWARIEEKTLEQSAINNIDQYIRCKHAEYMEERTEVDTDSDSEIERFVAHNMDFLVKNVIKIEDINNQIRLRKWLSDERGMLLDLQYAIEVSFNVANEAASRIGLGSKNMINRAFFFERQDYIGGI